MEGDGEGEGRKEEEACWLFFFTEAFGGGFSYRGLAAGWVWLVGWLVGGGSRYISLRIKIEKAFCSEEEELPMCFVPFFSINVGAFHFFMATLPPAHLEALHVTSSKRERDGERGRGERRCPVR